MITGNYAVSLKTPMGMESGILTLNQSGGELTGTLKAFGSANPIAHGKADGNRFEFSGSVRKLFMRIDYKAAGVVEGDTLTATADTKYGQFVIRGTRR